MGGLGSLQERGSAPLVIRPAGGRRADLIVPASWPREEGRPLPEPDLPDPLPFLARHVSDTLLDIPRDAVGLAIRAQLRQLVTNPPTRVLLVYPVDEGCQPLVRPDVAAIVLELVQMLDGLPFV